MGVTFKGTICISLVLANLAFSPLARASHAANFLDALQSEVTNRLVTAGTNVSPVQLRALSSAARSLSRDTKTLATDLGALASAVEQLNARFSGDETFAELEANAIADYFAEAHARLDGVHLWIGTNSVSKGLNNQLAKASGALERAENATNGVPAQARALAAAFNRILPLERKVQSLFDEPTVTIPPPVVNPPSVPLPPAVPPGTPGLAPDSIGTRTLDLKENKVVNDQTVFYFSTAQTGAQIYNVHQPEELGLWQYVRTGANSGVIAVTPDYPHNAGTRLLDLTFTSANSGTFTATTFDGEVIVGVIVLGQ